MSFEITYSYQDLLNRFVLPKYVWTFKIHDFLFLDILQTFSCQFPSITIFSEIYDTTIPKLPTYFKTYHGTTDTVVPMFLRPCEDPKA